jgi:hypothetical protein
VARGLGLPVTDTLGLLILAKRAGIIDVVRPLPAGLEAAEFRIDARLRAWVLTTAGEDGWRAFAVAEFGSPPSGSAVALSDPI